VTLIELLVVYLGAQLLDFVYFFVILSSNSFLPLLGIHFRRRSSKNWCRWQGCSRFFSLYFYIGVVFGLFWLLLVCWFVLMVYIHYYALWVFYFNEIIFASKNKKLSILFINQFFLVTTLFSLPSKLKLG